MDAIDARLTAATASRKAKSDLYELLDADEKKKADAFDKLIDSPLTSAWEKNSRSSYRSCFKSALLASRSGKELTPNQKSAVTFWLDNK